MKPVEELTPDDLLRYPLWRFANRDEIGEAIVEPVAGPVTSLRGFVIGKQVHLMDGSRRWALIGNFDHNDPWIEHFLTLALWHCDKWLHLARYHDVDRDTAGPVAFCKALELVPEQVFPISFDLREHVIGETSILKGAILLEPRERLTRRQLIGLAASRL